MPHSTATCSVCGTAFTRSPGPGRPRLTCSRECAARRRLATARDRSERDRLVADGRRYRALMAVVSAAAQGKLREPS